jgi:demethylmenaquinone methyltransferase/2-methoxy-6-polyprenyl-1,4-benzoquinol methylase
MNFDHFDFIAPLYHRAGKYSHLETMMSCADLPTTGRLLDAGGGTGRVAKALSDHARGIVVADASFGMLRFAASSRTFETAAAISESLPFQAESFERVIMVDALHHVINQADTARELWRVLKPGGRIVIEEPDIRVFGVKLIAIAEKLLLMRSRFLSPDQIAKLFEFGKTSIHSEDATAWVVIEKP